MVPSAEVGNLAIVIFDKAAVTPAKVVTSILKAVADANTPCVSSIIVNKAIIPANAPTTPTITSMVVCAFLPTFANLVTPTSAAKHSIIESIAAVAKAIFSGLIRLRIAIAATIIRIAADIFISIVPALSACSPANLDMYTIAPNNASNPAITVMPLTISLVDILLTSFIVIANIPIAAAMPNSIRPALLALFPA